MSLYNDYTTVEDTVTDVKAINNAIKNILFTRIGSVPGKPEFGSDLYKVLFNQMDHITHDQIEMYIKEALNIWEPRILVNSVDIEEVPEYNRLIATIYYEYRDKGLDLNDQLSINLYQ